MAAEDPVDGRVHRLETEFEYVRRDLDEIKADQKEILRELRRHDEKFGDMDRRFGEMDGRFTALEGKMPTIGQFWGMIGTVAVIALTVVILIVGGMSLGLAYLA